MAVIPKKSGFFLDTSAFIPSFTRIATKMIPTKANNAAFKVAAMILKDANTIEPKTPREIGDLQASGEFHPSSNPMKLGGIIGFNKDYAARLHEAPTTWNFTLPGSGPKYLESKLMMLKDKYMKFWATLI